MVNREERTRFAHRALCPIRDMKGQGVRERGFWFPPAMYPRRLEGRMFWW